MNIWPNSRAQDTLLKSERCRPPDFMFEIQLRWESGQFPANHNPIPCGVHMDDQMSFTNFTSQSRQHFTAQWSILGRV